MEAYSLEFSSDGSELLTLDRVDGEFRLNFHTLLPRQEDVVQYEYFGERVRTICLSKKYLTSANVSIVYKRDYTAPREAKVYISTVMDNNGGVNLLIVDVEKAMAVECIVAEAPKRDGKKSTASLERLMSAISSDDEDRPPDDDVRAQETERVKSIVRVNTDFWVRRLAPSSPDAASADSTILICNRYSETAFTAAVEVHDNGSMNIVGQLQEGSCPHDSTQRVTTVSSFDPCLIATTDRSWRALGTHVNFTYLRKVIAKVRVRDVRGVHRHPARPDLFFVHSAEPGGMFVSLCFDDVDLSDEPDAPANAAATTGAAGEKALPARTRTETGRSTTSASSQALSLEVWTSRKQLRMAPKWVTTSWKAGEEKTDVREEQPQEEAEATLASLARLGPRCIAPNEEQSLDTLLHVAVRAGSLEAVKALLASPAADYPTALLTVNARGKTALDVALDLTSSESGVYVRARTLRSPAKLR